MTHDAELAIPNIFTALVLNVRQKGTREERKISARSEKCSQDVWRKIGGKGREARYKQDMPLLFNGSAHRPKKPVNARGTQNVCRRISLTKPLSSQARWPLEPPAI
jgi:hypothetical protein